MTLNYWMIVEKYPNQTKWLAIRFPAVKSSLYLTKNQLGGQAPHVFKNKNKKTKKLEEINHFTSLQRNLWKTPQIDGEPKDHTLPVGLGNT
jgi:hypothetical protein